MSQSVINLSAEEAVPQPMEPDKQLYTQYSSVNGTVFRAMGSTVPRMASGMYTYDADTRGIFARTIEINDAELLRFPNTIADVVINEFSSFWALKDEYSRRGEQHKRGFLLHGPPGGGKTSVITFIIREFIKNDGVVFYFNGVLIPGLRDFREIEPERKILVLLEDIDSLLKTNLEAPLLQFLDGSVKHINTIVIATTNHLQELPSRLKHRPSRFDRVEFIDFPTIADRKIFIKAKSFTMSPIMKRQLLKDSKGFTFAHIKEMILSVEVYKLPYKKSLERITAMSDALKKDAFGFESD